MIENTAAALARIPDETDRRRHAHLIFTAHSIPLAMAANCRYETQLLDACRVVSDAVQAANWQLAYQSRSGPPSQPWLEPDVNDVLRKFAGEKVRDVVVVPIGFISDHMEVLYDLRYRGAANEPGIGHQYASRRHGRHASALCADDSRTDRRTNDRGN